MTDPLRHLLLRRFAEQSDQIAVSMVSGDITYADLGSRVAALAKATRGFECVGVLSTRRSEAYCAVLAAFFSGRKFVPLNPAFPGERLKKIIRMAKIDVVVCDTTTLAQGEGLGVFAVNSSEIEISHDDTLAQLSSEATNGNDIAYQMFTSGSTGDPKGVPICYDNLSHYVLEVSEYLKLPVGGRYSQLFDLSFDLSIHDIFVALTRGGTIVPASEIDLMMPHMYLAQRRIDHWFSVPLLARQAATGQGRDEPQHLLTSAAFCGEALPNEYADSFCQFLKPNCKLYNLYGPTEATIAFSARSFDSDLRRFATVPIGAPFGKNRIALVTQGGKLIESPSDGDMGELLLAGPQVFKGYTPPVEGEAFVQGSEGQRYYRSGDLVHMCDGELLHVGRSDSQIKFHGYRVELGEIESAFRQNLFCNVAVAMLLGHADSARIVLAYERDTEIDDLSPLAETLPSYMIPAELVRLEQMPTNINGKIDRKALKELAAAR